MQELTRVYMHQGVGSTYFVTIFHITGSGLLGSKIATLLGAPSMTVWITTVLTFQAVVLSPAISQAADYWGRKWFLVVPLIFGLVGCLIVSRANSIGVVIAGQAIAGTALTTQALSSAVTSEILPRKHRGLAQVLVLVPAAVASILGIYISGALCDKDPANFRIYWYITTAFYLISAGIIAFFYNPPTRQLQHLTLGQKIASLDIVGCTLLGISLLGICLGLTWSQNPYSWRNAHVLVPFIIGWVVAGCLAVHATWFKKDGFFHHRLFQSRNFFLVEIALIADGILYICANNYLGFQLFIMYGYSPWRTSLVYSITWYSYLVVSPLLGWLITKTLRPKWISVLGFGCYTLFFGLMAGTNLYDGVNLWGYQIFLGIGVSGAIIGLITVAQLSIPPELISPGTGLMIATRAAGSAIGLVLFNAILDSTLSSHLGPMISHATVPLGLPKSSVETLIAALRSGNPSALEHVPGITSEIIQAATIAFRKTYNIAFRNGYAAAAAFAAVGMIRMFIRALGSPSKPFRIRSKLTMSQSLFSRPT